MLKLIYVDRKNKYLTLNRAKSYNVWQKLFFAFTFFDAE